MWTSMQSRKDPLRLHVELEIELSSGPNGSGSASSEGGLAKAWGGALHKVSSSRMLDVPYQDADERNIAAVDIVIVA